MAGMLGSLDAWYNVYHIYILMPVYKLCLCTHQGKLAELQRYKCSAEDELRSLRARSAAHDSLRNQSIIFTASEDMCVQIETLKVQKCV